MNKPLGTKSYGSIPHFSCSKVGIGDHKINPGQEKICLSKPRDEYDLIIVHEKLDGSNVGVVKLKGEIVALTRSGNRAGTSPFKLHHIFAKWVAKNRDTFDCVLNESERICGEWLIQAHGTKYDLKDREPFVVFDVFVDNKRLIRDKLIDKVACLFSFPPILHIGSSLSIEEAKKLLGDSGHYGADKAEGVVYRVERKGRVEFLGKYVRKDHQPGIYLPEISGKEAIWNVDISEF